MHPLLFAAHYKNPRQYDIMYGIYLICEDLDDSLHYCDIYIGAIAGGANGF